MKKYRGIRLLAWVLTAAVLIQFNFFGSIKAEAATRKLTLQQAQELGIANSAAYNKTRNQIEIQEAKYAAAVKSIKMKQKNMSTFRWTPLLSFKFPEKPTLADEYEWQYKPLQISCVITELTHQLCDDRLASREAVSLLYVETYVCQEKIAFYEQNLEKAQETLEKNRIRRAAGQASQSDLDKAEQKISRLTTDLVLQMRTYETKKSQLSKLINLDVTSGYKLESPFIEADIPRDILDKLTADTLEHDHEYYNIKLETALSMASLDMMERMMRSQYGEKMDSISPYIRQARSGAVVDSNSFKKAYNQMLKDVDARWNGSVRILFIRINKEWFKGKISGSRYVEDDPYALYSGALECADAVREQETAKENLTARVKNDFETVKTAQIAYTDAVKTCRQLEEELRRSTQLNRLGMLSYEELSDLQEEYQQQAVGMLDLLAEYSRLLYAYDRLTCGGITAYLHGTDLTMETYGGGNSYLAEEVEGKAYYYLNYAVADHLFRLGVSIPEEFSLEITHFALYVNNTQIGERTQTDRILEHLALDLDRTEQVQIYLYHENELVDICEIDVSVYQDTLDIRGGYTLIKEEDAIKRVAQYSYTYDSTGMAVLSIQPADTEPIAQYCLQDERGNHLSRKDKIPVGEPFHYLSLLAGDFSQLKIVFYDESGRLLYTGRFESASMSVIVETE